MEKQELKSAIVNQLLDFNWRLDNLYKIPTEDWQTIQFKPNTIQRQILKTRSDKRDIILKYRQGWVSTLYIIILLDEVLFWGTNINNIFITHRQDLLDEFFRKARFIYDNIPENIKAILPEPSIDNANELYFAKTRTGKMLNNSLKISLDVRWRTPWRVHVSEFAFMDPVKQMRLKQSIDQFRKTKITIETTANGVWNVFHKACMQAKNWKGTYKLLFFPWYIEERNKEKPPVWFCLTEEEINLKENYNLTDDQIYWRRLKIEDSNSSGFDWLKKFHEENPITIDSAFISSGASVFDLSANYRIVRPIFTYNDIKFFQEPQDELCFWVDIAEGWIKWDFSTIVAYNKHGELVCTYRWRVNEEILAKKMNDILTYEKDWAWYLGWIIPENNLWRLFIKICQDYPWKYLIHSEIKTDIPIEESAKEPNKYGFRMTQPSKDYIIRKFRGAIHKEIVEVSEEIKSEIETFEYDTSNKPNAVSPNHDDILVASMISYFAVTKIYGLIEYDKPEKAKLWNRAEDIRKADFIRMQLWDPEDFESESMLDNYYEIYDLT